MKIERIIGLIVLIALILGGIILFSDDDPSTSSGQAGSPQAGQGDDSYEELPYVEIVEPSGFVNTDGITVGELIGKKIILIDFLTYSCINCQRTFPYINSWYDKYKDQGLEVIGIHTPEFAFEKKLENVEDAMKRFGINHPIVLDNDFKTWRAFENNYWPRKYLIDINGNIVYDHIGEGGYEETESKIIELLEERKIFLGEDGEVSKEMTDIEEYKAETGSPEVYFGASRNEFLANGTSGVLGEQDFDEVDRFNAVGNALYLSGKWNIGKESSTSLSDDAKITFRYLAKNVFMVADSQSEGGAKIKILKDGEEVKAITVDQSKLYHLINDEKGEEHVLEIYVEEGSLEAFTFTFG